MIKIVLPVLPVSVVMIAGIFAFVPVQQASTVHTTVFAESSSISETIATSGGAAETYTITCPANSDGCHILEVYIVDPDADAQNTDIGAVNGTINGETISFQLDGATADGLSNAARVITGVGGLAIGNGDTITIATAGAETAHSLVVIAIVEGGEDIEVTVA